MDSAPLYVTVETLTRIVFPTSVRACRLCCLPVVNARSFVSGQTPGECHAGGTGAGNQQDLVCRTIL